MPITALQLHDNAQPLPQRPREATVEFKMSENSLFACSLRSPWWISFVLVACVALISKALLPSEYFIYGALGGFPIFVVGCIAAWRQLRAPSAAKVQTMLDQAQAMPWAKFSQALTRAWAGQGYGVNAPSKGAVDLRLTQNGQTTLVSAKRWKAPPTAWNHCASCTAPCRLKTPRAASTWQGKAP
jgi:restriction system protein